MLIGCFFPHRLPSKLAKHPTEQLLANVVQLSEEKPSVEKQRLQVRLLKAVLRLQSAWEVDVQPQWKLHLTLATGTGLRIPWAVLPQQPVGKALQRIREEGLMPKIADVAVRGNRRLHVRRNPQKTFQQLSIRDGQELTLLPPKSISPSRQSRVTDASTTDHRSDGKRFECS